MKAYDSFKTANVATILSLILSLGAGASCASTGDGTGSESHFACKKDEDCEKYGLSLVCIDKECVKDETEGGGGGDPGSRGAAATGGSGGNTEPTPFGTSTLPPLVIDPVCGSYSLGARLEAGDTFVRTVQQRRKQLTDACAALSRQDAPAVPTDDDLTSLCGAARTSIVEMLAGDGLTSGNVEPLWVDAEAQFACEEAAAAAAGCSSCSFTLEARCPSIYQATRGCAGECSGECFGGLTECEGSCRGNCNGTCEGECSTGSGPDCSGGCQGTCTGTCTGACLQDAPLTCSGVCIGECSEPAPIAGCAAPITPCGCAAASDATAACGALGLLRGGNGRVTLWRAGSEFRSEELLSVHEVLQRVPIMILAAESVSPGLPSQADLPASCVAEIGPRVTTLNAQASAASVTLDVLLRTAMNLVGAEVPVR